MSGMLFSPPVISYPNPSLEFILDTDASGSAIVAVLSQKVDEQERVIAYVSRALSKSERNYSIMKRELLAVVRVVKHFKPYLLYNKLKIRSDHDCLKYLSTFKEPEGPLARWIEQMGVFDFEITYRKGTNHTNTDVISRPIIPLNIIEAELFKGMRIFDETLMQTYQKKDDEINKIRVPFRTNTLVTPT
ncbi:Retrovirus-related Pol polyprotein [Thelohanellus kitauei]|uniref:Retrovirus-related Pol polyprotein n=1 Tax=Thelohanellus kitauei TaxID=669202 RepID=A0A0C2MVY4_THEKT|nr:Retrovirus-related Pol polyprotein [Thelohanellus kitauei]